MNDNIDKREEINWEVVFLVAIQRIDCGSLRSVSLCGVSGNPSDVGHDLRDLSTFQPPLLVTSLSFLTFGFSKI